MNKMPTAQTRFNNIKGLLDSKINTALHVEQQLIDRGTYCNNKI